MKEGKEKSNFNDIQLLSVWKINILALNRREKYQELDKFVPSRN
jgi:hypothetical protein